MKYLLLCAGLFLGACSSSDMIAQNQLSNSVEAINVEGKVTAIQAIQDKPTTSEHVVGIFSGAGLGQMIGNQFGGPFAEALGSIAGGAAGAKVTNELNDDPLFLVTVVSNKGVEYQGRVRESTFAVGQQVKLSVIDNQIAGISL